MTRLPSSDETWAPCDSGSLERYASRHRGRRRLMGVAKVAGVSAACVLALAVGRHLSRHDMQSQEFNFGGIACHEVQGLMPQYVMDELPAETTDKIRRHLAECPMCQEIMRRMKQKEMDGQVGCADPNCHDRHDRLAYFANLATHAPLGGASPRVAWLLTEASRRSDVRSRP